MKKFIAVLLATLLLVNLVGCREQEQTINSSTPNDSHSSVSTLEEESDSVELPTDTEKNTQTIADNIIEKYNSKIKEMYSGRTESEIKSVLVTFDRKEYISQYDVTSYEYSIPNNAVGMCIFEDENSGEATFGSIELNLSSYNKQNEAEVLQGFMQMCYFFSYAFDTSINEEKFMSIWNDMRNSRNKQAIYPDVMYQIQDSGNYLSFSIKYN